MADDRTANVVLTADTSGYSQQMLAAQTSTNQTVTSVMKLVDALDRLAKNTGRKLEIISATTTAGLVAAGVAAGRFESQMSTLQASAKITGREIGTMSKAVDELRRGLPVSTEQVIALATALQKMGSNPQNIQKLAETFIKLGAATGEDIGGLATGMIELQRAMGTTEGSTTKFANSVAGLSANLGVSATGILQFSQNLAPIARTVGMTQTEVMGLSAAFLKSGQDGFAAANATVKMITDISRATRYGSADLSMYANLVGKTTSEFSKMGASDQLQALFSAINKAGPDAIKVLERMGLDGPRALKSIQGLAQSGQLGKSISEATRAFNGDDLNKGSEAAMDGLNDSLTKLRNTLTSIAQAFGAPLLRPLNMAVDAMTKMANAARSIMQPLSLVVNSIGGLAGVGAAGAGIMGAALSNMGTLAAVAGAYMLSRSSLGAGFRARREERNPGYRAPGVYRTAIDRLNAGDGSRFQQGMFRAGQMRYMVSPRRALDAMNARTGGGQGLRLPQRAAMLASLGYQGALGFARSQVDPLRWTAATNIVERSRLSRMNMADQWRSVAGRGGAEPASFGAALRGAISATARFSGSLVSATAGLGRLAAVTAARGIGGAIGRGASSMLSAVGGVAGLGLMAGIGTAMYIGGKRADSAEFKENLATDAGAQASVNKYASSLGQAGSAAMSFAETLKKAEGQVPVTEGQSGRVRESDVKAATVAGRKLTDTTLADMTESQAAAYAGALLSGTPNASMTQALKLDLIQQFNPEAAQRILDQSGTANYNPGGVIGEDESKMFLRFFGSTKEFQQQTRAAASTVGVQQSQLYSQFGSEESNKYTAAAVNQILDKFGENPNLGAQVALSQSLEEILGGNLKLSTNDQTRLHEAGSARERSDIFQELVGATEAGKNFINTLDDTTRYARDYRPPEASEVEFTPLEKSIRETEAGRFARHSNIVSTALSQEDNANANLQAATGFAAAMVESTGSTQGANDALQALKARIGDVRDPLYQLASSAQTAASRLSGYASAYGSQAENAGKTRGALASAYASPANAPDREERVIAAEDAYETARSGLFQQYKNIVRSYREFDISRGRQEADFQKSRARQDAAFSLQQSRSQADFDLSRARGEDDYQLQRQRGQFDYDLQRQHSQEDFDRSRRRAEEDYQHQVAMMARQTAMSISDVYTRITTQPTWDANNLLTNAQDQLGRMNQQQSDLGTLRGMGVSGDVIEMMGLNDFQNQQQLARFVADLASDPSLVQAFNENIAGKLDMGKAFATDEDSDAWKEMQRSFSLSMTRSADDYDLMVGRGADSYNRGIIRMAEDYDKMLTRGADDYTKMLERQNADYDLSVQQTVTDWNTQMGRAKEDLARSFEEVTGTFTELETAALDALTGTAKTQMSALSTALGDTRTAIKDQIEGARTDITNGLTPLFGSPEAAQAALNAAVMINNAQPRATTSGNISPTARADGGIIPGYSPHAKADNIPAMLTAGEYVQPVSTVDHYGTSTMEAIRQKKIPKWALQGFASGGLVEFGRMLQGMGYRVGEHPSFGGVHAGHMKNSLHYSGRAIDVNYGPSGTSLIEQQAMDRIVGLAKGYGLSTIWRAPGHFDHAHFDTGNYSKIGSSTTIGNNPISGMGSSIDVAKLMRGKNVQAVEQSLSNMVSGGTYKDGTFLNSLGYLLSKVANVEPNAESWHGDGAIFSGARQIGVGERGQEMVLPLNARGADFLAETMERYSPGERNVRGGQVVETKTITYNQTFDQSTQISGPITVQAQDPNEMARKLEEKKRMDQLRRPR